MSVASGDIAAVPIRVRSVKDAVKYTDQPAQGIDQSISIKRKAVEAYLRQIAEYVHKWAIGYAVFSAQVDLRSHLGPIPEDS